MRARLRPLAIFLFPPLAFFGEALAYGKQMKHEVQYDEGGTFKTTLDVPSTERVKIFGEIRAFIWDHWSGRGRGRLQMVTQSIEGQVKVQKIFIEPDAQGHWHVRDEVQADVRRGVQPAKPQVTVDEYDEVPRIEVNSGQIIPDSKKRATGTYRLLLTNKSKGIRWKM